VIQAGLDDITAKTCIRFQTRTSESDYVFVVRGDSVSGCWSYVGRIGGRQELNLQVATSGGHCIWHHVVSHEFIHAIGYYHEQSRTDRDDFVNINWDNIYPGNDNSGLNINIKVKIYVFLSYGYLPKTKCYITQNLSTRICPVYLYLVQ
jgi:hypothetical protein